MTTVIETEIPPTSSPEEVGTGEKIKDDKVVKKGRKGGESTGIATSVKRLESNLKNDGVIGGKRVRKGVTRFEGEMKEIKKRNEVSAGNYVSKGGVTIGDMPGVIAGVSKLTPDGDEIKVMHSLMFGHTGTKTMRKRDIKKFEGVQYTNEKEKIVKAAATKNVAVLKKVAAILGIETSSNQKDEIAAEIAGWMLKPVAPTKEIKVPAAKKATKANKPPKTTGKRAASKKAKPAAKKPRKTKAAKEADEAEDSQAEVEKDEEGEDAEVSEKEANASEPEENANGEANGKDHDEDKDHDEEEDSDK